MDLSVALSLAINVYQTFVVGPLREHRLTYEILSAYPLLSESNQCALCKRFRPLFLAEWCAFWG